MANSHRQAANLKHTSQQVAAQLALSVARRRAAGDSPRRRHSQLETDTLSARETDCLSWTLNSSLEFRVWTHTKWSQNEREAHNFLTHRFERPLNYNC